MTRPTHHCTTCGCSTEHRLLHQGETIHPRLWQGSLRSRSQMLRCGRCHQETFRVLCESDPDEQG